MKAFQQINISPTDNGIIVKVGCRTLVWEEKNLQYFLTSLGEYLRNPEETEQKWTKKMGWTSVPTSPGNIILSNGDTARFTSLPIAI